MKRRIIALLLMLSLISVITACKNDNNNKKEDKTKETQAVKGEEQSTEYETDSATEEDELLTEVTQLFGMEKYELVYSAMRNNTEILSVLANKQDNKVCVRIYDLKKKKFAKSVESTMEEGFFDGKCEVEYFAPDTLFMVNKDKNLYVPFNKRMAPQKMIELPEGIKYDFVAPDASKIIYLQLNTNTVCAYDIEMQMQRPIYQFEENIQVFSYVGMSSDMNHLLFRYNNSESNKTGYADVHIEEHDVDYKENLSYTIEVADNEYVYFDYWKKPNEICFYSLDRPRQVTMFSLDNEKETETIRFLGRSSYFFTVLSEKEDEEVTNICRIYDRSQGALIERIKFSTTEKAEITNVTISPDLELVCITEETKNEGVRVFVWNLAIATGVIEDNELLEEWSEE